MRSQLLSAHETTDRTAAELSPNAVCYFFLKARYKTSLADKGRMWVGLGQ
jgi:hypothetical protein